MRTIIERFDNEISWEAFYKQYGADLFVKFFRCYTLDHPDLNLNYDLQILESTDSVEDNCNAINLWVDNILIKILQACDKLDVLLTMPELMFKGKKCVQKLAKVLQLISYLYRTVTEKQAKYI